MAQNHKQYIQMKGKCLTNPSWQLFDLLGAGASSLPSPWEGEQVKHCPGGQRGLHTSHRQENTDPLLPAVLDGKLGIFRKEKITICCGWTGQSVLGRPIGEYAEVLEVSLARKTLVFLNETIRKQNIQSIIGDCNKQQSEGRAWARGEVWL